MTYLRWLLLLLLGFPQAGQVVKNPWDGGWSLGREEPMREGMATHFGGFAWRIPRTEEPGRLQSTGWKRVGHKWRDLARTQAAAMDTFLSTSLSLSPPSLPSTPASNPPPFLPSFFLAHPFWVPSCLFLHLFTIYLLFSFDRITCT